MNLEQGGKDWLAWRRQGIGSSDAPIIMGVSPWCDVLTLYKRKRGELPEQESNWAMARGTRLEPKVREVLEKSLGVLEPATLTHNDIPWMRASVDGISLDGKVVVEIKCPGQADHAIAQAGQVPPKYIPQVQHILAVSDCDTLIYASYNSGELLTVSVPRDEAYIALLIKAEQAFWDAIQAGIPPVVEGQRTDDAWLEAAVRYREAKTVYDLAAESLETAKAALLALTDTGSSGAGIEVSRVNKKGNVDYKAIPVLKGLDLEPYRKPGHTEWRITIGGDK